MVHFEPPPEEAYGRVTDAEIFRVVADAAVKLVDDLNTEYLVTLETATAAADFPLWHLPETPTVRVLPREGAALKIMITEFPGVVVRVGELGQRFAFPTCGCDACREDPSDLVDELHSLVAAIVTGRYREGLTKRRLWRQWDGHGGSSELKRGEWKQHGELGERTWPAWPRRA